MLLFVVAFAASLGAFIQSLTGFGSAVVMMTVLPYFFDMVTAPAISNSICLALAVMMSWRFRKKARAKLIVLPTILYVFASATVISHLGDMDMGMLTVAFGVFLIIISIYFLFIAKDKAMKMTMPMMVAAGLLSGVCDGLFSIGGPLMAIYFISVTEDHESYLGNMQTHFAINNTLTFSTRIVNGFYSFDFLPLTLCGIVGLFFGQMLGIKSAGKLDRDKTRRLVYLYVGISGVITIVRQLL